MSCCGADNLLVGSRPTVQGEFKLDDVLADPTAMHVITRDPTGAQVTYTHPNALITNPSVGIWEFQFPGPVTIAGTWWVYFVGDGGVQAASQIKLKFRGANVAI